MFSTEINNLISSYVRAIEANNAAVFIGSGLSIPSGASNWKDLLRDCGNEINLDVDKEYDLTKLAQYYVNENGANKHKLLQHIINKLKQIKSLGMTLYALQDFIIDKNKKYLKLVR